MPHHNKLAVKMWYFIRLFLFGLKSQGAGLSPLSTHYATDKNGFSVRGFTCITVILSEYDYFSGDEEKNYWKKTKEDMGKLQKSRRGL